MSVLTKRFMQTLSTELQEYQRDHNVLITVTPAVVSGAADITGEIQSCSGTKNGRRRAVMYRRLLVPLPCPAWYRQNLEHMGRCTPLPSRTC